MKSLAALSFIAATIVTTIPYAQEPGSAPATGAQDAESLLHQYIGQEWRDFIAQFREHNAFPNSPKAEECRVEAWRRLKLLEALSDAMPAHYVGQKYRYISILEIELACAFGALNPREFQEDRRRLAQSALDHLAVAEREVNRVAPDGDQYTPERWEWTRAEHFSDHVNYMKAIAVAIKWDIDGATELKQEVEALWYSIDPEYRRQYQPTARVLRKALNMDPVWLNEKILALAFGSCFLLLLVVIALFVKNPSEFQLLVWRVVLALAGAACATVIPGALDVQIKGIGAGGGFGLFVIIFAFNPARLITENKKKRRARKPKERTHEQDQLAS